MAFKTLCNVFVSFISPQNNTSISNLIVQNLGDLLGRVRLRYELPGDLRQPRRQHVLARQRPARLYDVIFKRQTLAVIHAVEQRVLLAPAAFDFQYLSGVIAGSVDDEPSVL